MLTVPAGLAEFERELKRTRTSEGCARTKANGVKLGPHFKLTPHQHKERGETLTTARFQGSPRTRYSFAEEGAAVTSGAWLLHQNAPATLPLLPSAPSERPIRVIRGQKVMLDSDLAELYGVETGQLNRAVKRNLPRFPDDLMFQLTEKESLRCQIGTSKTGRGGRR